MEKANTTSTIEALRSSKVFRKAAQEFYNLQFHINQNCPDISADATDVLDMILEAHREQQHRKNVKAVPKAEKNRLLNIANANAQLKFKKDEERPDLTPKWRQYYKGASPVVTTCTVIYQGIKYQGMSICSDSEISANKRYGRMRSLERAIRTIIEGEGLPITREEAENVLYDVGLDPEEVQFKCRKLSE